MLDQIKKQLLNYGSMLCAMILCPMSMEANDLELLFVVDQKGDGKSKVNVTGKDGELGVEVDEVIYMRWGQGSISGDSWGGGALGELMFKNLEVRDYHGKDGTSAYFSGDASGMGIWSKEGKAWEMDGRESFTLAASESYEFRGFTLRNGYRFDDKCHMAISSTSWSGLKELVDSDELGYGVRFYIENGVGVFVLTSEMEKYDVASILGDFADKVSLRVRSGSSIRFSNHLGGEKGVAFRSLLIRPGASELGGNRSAVIGIGGMSLEMNRF